jgi:Nucleosome assembly protein (NAP)
VIEQTSALLGFDEYITPEDAHLIATCLRGVTVTRPDVETEPRSLQLTFTFAENEFFENKELVKKFAYQKCGMLASEPVGIRWKEGKDLTEGVSAAAVKAWEERKAGKKGEEAGKKLAELMKKGPSSFFNFFEWTGQHESLGEVKEDEEDEEDDEDDESGLVEVFPNGEELAVQIAEDVYPNAPKYFSTFSLSLYTGMDKD